MMRLVSRIVLSAHPVYYRKDGGIESCGPQLRGRRPRRRLVVRIADENPTWGYTRIRGALKHVGHRVARSTIARILKEQGIPPVPARPTARDMFLRAHWGAIAGADFFTTEVWTWRGW
jgi:hypothetical protein